MSAYIQVALLLIVSGGFTDSKGAVTRQSQCPDVNGQWMEVKSPSGPSDGAGAGNADRKRLSLGNDGCDILGSLTTKNFSHEINGVWNQQKKYYDITIKSTQTGKGCVADLKGKLEVKKERGKVKIKTTIDKVESSSCSQNLEFDNVMLWAKP